MWREIKRLIHEHNRFLLTTHVNPDGDGFGSACAITELLLLLGKQVGFVVDSPIPDRFRFLDYHSIFTEFDPSCDYSSYEVLIVLDANRAERIGRVAQIAELPNIHTLCIDHHNTDRPLGNVAALEPNACSTGAMVYTLYREYGFDLNVRAASGVYTSVISDTGRFSYSSTTRKAHKIADDCIKIGVDPELMYSALYQQVPMTHVHLLAEVLRSMRMYENNRLVVFTLDEDGRHDDIVDERGIPVDMEYLLDFGKSIAHVECVVLLRKVGEGVRVSLRSKGDLDVGQVCRILGGGGHAKAAGAVVDGTVTGVESLVINALKQLLSTAESPSAAKPLARS